MLGFSLCVEKLSTTKLEKARDIADNSEEIRNCREISENEAILMSCARVGEELPFYKRWPMLISFQIWIGFHLQIWRYFFFFFPLIEVNFSRRIRVLKDQESLILNWTLSLIFKMEGPDLEIFYVRSSLKPCVVNSQSTLNNCSNSELIWSLSLASSGL